MVTNNDHQNNQCRHSLVLAIKYSHADSPVTLCGFGEGVVVGDGEE